MLMRLLLLKGFIIALIGLCVKPDGDPGGELAMAQLIFVVATKWLAIATIAYMMGKVVYEFQRANLHYLDGGMCRR